MKDYVVSCDFDLDVVTFSYATPSELPSWPSGEMWISIAPEGFDYNKTLSFWERVKLAFTLIITGDVYESRVAIGKDKVVALKSWINSLEGC